MDPEEDINNVGVEEPIVEASIVASDEAIGVEGIEQTADATYLTGTTLGGQQLIIINPSDVGSIAGKISYESELQYILKTIILIRNLKCCVLHMRISCIL